MAERRMSMRLGQVLYWLGCWIAAILVAIGGVNIIETHSAIDRWQNVIVYGVPALITWVIGRALYYVLAGR